MVDGNLKPDPLDKPRRRGREERKEIFKREVEITKRFLEKVNIQVNSNRQQGLVFSFFFFFVKKCFVDNFSHMNEKLIYNISSAILYIRFVRGY